MVDNGRTNILANKKYREILKCIRCGACINTCPVYRRSGGYSYGYTIPGPIGSVLAPLKDMHKYYTLSYASSLCGSCSDVCPVKIDLQEMLYQLRADAVEKKCLSFIKKFQLRILDKLLYHKFLYNLFGFLGSRILKYVPRFFIYHRFNAWGKSRDFPDVPGKSFRQWYKKYVIHE
jgi:L-lactate dehydrogenase complex protein LldF